MSGDDEITEEDILIMISFIFQNCDNGVTISGVSSTPLLNEATITWTTDQNADSQIDYGTTISHGSSTTLDSTLITSHSQTLLGLSPNTLYHYRVKSRNDAGTLVLSSDFTFTTGIDSDGDGFSDEVEIHVLTDPFDACPDDNSDAAYPPDFNNDGVVDLLNDVLEITSKAGSTSSDPDWNVTRRYDLNKDNIVDESDTNIVIAYNGVHCEVPDTTPPIITNILATPSESSVVITWDTVEPSTSQISYSTTLFLDNQTTLDPTLVTSHSQQINGLLADTTYLFVVHSKDFDGNQRTSPLYSQFTTL